MPIEPSVLRWCTITPMPYLDDLFLRLALDNSVALEVIYLRRSLREYPMEDGPAVGYRWKALESLASTVSLLWSSVSQRKTLWLVGGWGSPKYVLLLLLLSVMGRRFWLLTDAPIPEGRVQEAWKRALRRRLLQYWFTRCAGIIGTGKMAIERLIQMGVDETKLISIPCPLDESRFPVGEDYSKTSDNSVVIVCSGRLNIRDKRFDLALRAFAAVSAAAKNAVACKLRIAGSGPDEQILRELVEELGIGSCVEFVGWLRQDQLAELYSRGHVYLHPTDFEPYGVTVVEALYSGLFTVASDGVGAAVELVQDGVNGTVFPHGDLEKLTAALMDAVTAVAGGQIKKLSVRNASLAWKMDTYLETIKRVFSAS